jgi:hypothetical protein
MPADVVVGTLTTRAALEFRGNHPEQARAWRGQIALLHRAFGGLAGAQDWGLLLEYPLRRLGRRLDAVILAPAVIIVVEFKMGADVHGQNYIEQAQDYALCIRDFHRAARGRVIVPIVCVEHAPRKTWCVPAIIDSVAEVILANGTDLKEALQLAAGISDGGTLLSWREFDIAGYNPTPTIVEAARAVYAGHSVAEIGRTDAEGEALQRTAERLQYWAVEARERKEHIVCLVSGTPGAGKTLLGLNLVLADGAGRVAGEPAVMLTGNRPLVHVLRGALIADARLRSNNIGARRSVQGALQTLLDYLKEHAAEEASKPPEHVVVFDEAQRAWDAETGQKLLQRRRSEPELFLEILRRLPWACLVCLVGSGQEINRGEGGMALWADALDREASAGRAWRVVAPPSSEVEGSFPIEVDQALHLVSGLRAYRNERFGDWVDAVLSADLDRARALADAMTNVPAVISRKLRAMREWLLLRRRGGRRPGLVVSSGATRLVADGLPPAPMSSELHAIENWFLRSWPDFRGSDALEIPLSEFGCQGLELDYVGLSWGGDLVWSNDPRSWVPRRMRAPTWQVIRQPESVRYRLNSYRVLLTRAREGLFIYIPRGSVDDPTRSPREFDAIADALAAAGCLILS